MPILDGVQATRRIRVLPWPKKTVPIVALTAHAMAGLKEEYLAAGMDDYLSKPIDNLALFSLLNDVAAGLIGRSVERPRVSADDTSVVTIDPTRLEKVAEVMADEPFGEFFDVFLASAAERIGHIRKLVEQDDFEQIGLEAHTLLGTAGNFGALRLARLAVELRLACDNGDHDRARHLADKLTEAMNETSAAVLAWLNEKRAPHAA